VLAYRADRDLSASQKAIVAFRDALVAAGKCNRTIATITRTRIARVPRGPGSV